MSSGLSFGGALTHLKHGARVTRAGWNGKGMWLALVLPDRGGPIYGGPPVRREPHYGIRFPDSGAPRLLPWIGLKTADDGFVPWLASQTDLLAEDWEVVS